MFNLIKNLLSIAGAGSASNKGAADSGLPPLTRKERKHLKEIERQRQEDQHSKLRVVDLEPRIMLSATWVDVDALLEAANQMDAMNSDELLDDLLEGHGMTSAGGQMDDLLDQLSIGVAQAASGLTASEQEPTGMEPNAEPTSVVSDIDADGARTGLEVAFVDSNISDLNALIESLSVDHVIVVNSGDNGLEAINNAFAEFNGVKIDAVHIFAHGSDGTIFLGNQSIDAQALEANSLMVGSWADSLSADADILVYGCDVAAGPEGQQWVQMLADLTQADVAASDDLTGHGSLGGDWDLEYTVGVIETEAAVSTEGIANWQGVLGGAIIGETGTASLTDQFSTITLDYEYNNAVVILGPVSYGNQDNTTTLVGSVTGNTFEARLWEWEGFDGVHPAEDVGYMVVEQGVHTLDDGRVIQAGVLPSDGTDSTWMTVTFGTAFNSAPLIFSTAGSSNDGLVYTTQLRNVTTTGFEIRVRSSENDSLLIDQIENLNWVAFEAGSGTSGGNNYEAGSLNSDVTTNMGSFVTASLNGTTGPDRMLLGDLQTTYGPDAAELRYQNLNAGSVQLVMEEAIDEGHVSEKWGWAVFEAGALNNQAPTDLTLSASSVAENASNGTVVGQVTVTDESNDYHTFALSNDFNGTFAIDANSGQLTVADNSLLDYELNSSVTLTVEVTDSIGHSYEETFTIAVTNVNEAPVDLYTSTENIEINNASFESQALSDSNWTTSPPGWTVSGPAGDLNPSAASFSSGNGTDGANVGWAEAGGALSQTLSTNFDSTRNYHLTVDVGRRIEFASPQTYTVQLYAGATLLGSYSGMQGEKDGWETVDIDVVGGNHSAANGQALRIVLSSGGAQVQFDDVHLTATVASASIAENAANGTVVAQLTPIDPDSGDTFTYALTNSAGGRFAINTATGQITVAQGDRLNHEFNSSHTVAVRVTDSGGLTYTRSVIIDVSDVNESPQGVLVESPTILLNDDFNDGNVSDWTLSGGFSLSGQQLVDSSNGLSTAIYNDPSAMSWTDVAVSADISMIDDDTSGLILRYQDSSNYMVARMYTGSNTTTSLIQLVKRTGGAETILATVSNPAFLQRASDGEATGTYRMTFRAEGDSYTVELNGHSVFGTVTDATHTTGTIGLLNNYNQGARFDNVSVTSSAITVDENATDGTVVATSRGFDQDAGATLTYSLTDDADGRFAIDANTGVITVADQSAIDYEAATSHNVTFRVTDSAGEYFEEALAIDVVNSSVEAASDAFTLISGVPIVIDPLANDVDEDGDALGIVSIFDPANGNAMTSLTNAGDSATLASGTTVTLRSDGRLDVVSATDGIETFEYRVSDGGDSEVETVTLNTSTNEATAKSIGLVTRWDTTKPGSASNTITISAAPGSDNYTIYWGDGTSTTGASGSQSHVYATPGQYEVTIVGDFAGFEFNNGGDRQKITSVEQWGNIAFTDLNNSFRGAVNLLINATDTPDLTNVASLERMFEYAVKVNADLSAWDVSNVTNMNYMFLNANGFNQDISGWDTSNVTTMFGMFQGATAFNQDISGWDTSNVTNMSNLFYGATSFNQDISGWDIGRVTHMGGMFAGANAFAHDITGWDVSGVIDMNSMFFNNKTFNQDISGWDTSSVTNMASMFNEADAFNQDIGGWDTSSVTNMSSMFMRNNAFNQDISGWDTSNVTTMSNMFREATAFNQHLSAWDVSKVTSFQEMFYAATAFNGDLTGWNLAAANNVLRMFSHAYVFNGDLTGWDVTGLTSLQEMFQHARAFNQDISGWNVSNVNNLINTFIGAWAFNSDISGWDVSNVTRMDNLFNSALAFNQNITNWDIANVTHMGGMFAGANAFTHDITGWDVSGVVDMGSMFFNNKTFNQDISGWDTSSVTNMASMFNDADAFNQDIGGWETSSVTGMSQMFMRNNAFNQDISGWNTSNVTNMTQMFREATAFNQHLSDWDVSKVTSFQEMFYLATTFTGDLTGWNLAAANNVLRMFSHAYVFNGDLTGWDVSGLTSLQEMFHNARAFNQDISGWNVSNVTNLISTFNNAWAFNSDISGWDVSNVTRMDNLFNTASAFNQDITNWDIANVTHMGGMLAGANAFTHDITGWDVSGVVDMGSMFFNNKTFNQDISGWDVSNVTNMSSMFNEADAFNQDIGGWNTSNVTNMSHMFMRNNAFNQDIGGWNTSNVTNMSNMFRESTEFNQHLSAWDVSKVTSFREMFFAATAFDGDVTGWNLSAANDVFRMFRSANMFNGDVSGWNLGNLTSFQEMF